jgi:glyoxalase family protein
MASVAGLHHVTAIAGDPQENLDFYTDTLGLRLVKRSVNQDDPSRYHLFFADGEGNPGTDLTFFPWGKARRGQAGAGMTTRVAFAIRPESLDYWREGLDDAGSVVDETALFGDTVLQLEDPHGLDLALVASPDAADRETVTWDRSPVPAVHQLRGFNHVRLVERDAEPTARVLEDVLGLDALAQDDEITRYSAPDQTQGFVDLVEDPDAPRSSMGAGCVHHVAFQAGTRDNEAALREGMIEHGLSPTEVIDRHWFESVYAREPGGALFELATDEPGFTVDEPLESLGESLVLPPWMEDQRSTIASQLPELELPYPTNT